VNPRVRKLDSAPGPFRIMRIVGDNLVEMDRVDGKNRNYVRVATSQLRLCLGEEAEIKRLRMELEGLVRELLKSD